MDEETQRRWAERTVQAVNAAFPESEFVHWPSCQCLLPQAQGCATLIEQWNLAFSEAARLLNQAGCYLHERGHYLEALLLVQRALAIREKVLGAEHPDTAQSLNNLAFLYKARGNYPEALPLYQRALAICEKALGPEHPDTKSVCNGYTDLLKHMKSA